MHPYLTADAVLRPKGTVIHPRQPKRILTQKKSEAPKDSRLSHDSNRKKQNQVSKKKEEGGTAFTSPLPISCFHRPPLPARQKKVPTRYSHITQRKQDARQRSVAWHLLSLSVTTASVASAAGPIQATYTFAKSSCFCILES